MTTLTFRDFTWRSQHHLPSKHGSASHPHWHTYRARFWFSDPLDQDALAAQLEDIFGSLHGCALNAQIGAESTDEAMADWLLMKVQEIGKCVRVTLENDGQRGAEVTP